MTSNASAYLCPTCAPLVNAKPLTKSSENLGEFRIFLTKEYSSGLFNTFLTTDEKLVSNKLAVSIIGNFFVKGPFVLCSKLVLKCVVKWSSKCESPTGSTSLWIHGQKTCT